MDEPVKKTYRISTGARCLSAASAVVLLGALVLMAAWPTGILPAIAFFIAAFFALSLAANVVNSKNKISYVKRNYFK